MEPSAPRESVLLSALCMPLFADMPCELIFFTVYGMLLKFVNLPAVLTSAIPVGYEPPW